MRKSLEYSSLPLPLECPPAEEVDGGTRMVAYVLLIDLFMLVGGLWLLVRWLF